MPAIYDCYLRAREYNSGVSSHLFLGSIMRRMSRVLIPLVGIFAGIGMVTSPAVYAAGYELLEQSAKGVGQEYAGA